MSTDGGPAFPATFDMADDGRGMTLRDYFAAKAMQGALAGRTFDFDCVEQESAFAYRLADSMLKARQS